MSRNNIKKIVFVILKILDELKLFATGKANGPTFIRSRIGVIGNKSVSFAVLRQWIDLLNRSPQIHLLSTIYHRKF